MEGRYSLAIATRCVLHYDELLQIIPEARQPTDAQLIKIDMQQAFKACGHQHLEADALALCKSVDCMPEGAASLAQRVARVLLPYLNGKHMGAM